MRPERADESSYIGRSTRLACLLLHQRSASLDARERFAELASAARSRDGVAVLTCHRVELYAAVPNTVDPAEELARQLRADGEALRHAEVRVDEDAADHLFRVASGLDSVVVGEPQIANQLRRTFDHARAGGVDPILAALFQRALHLAREIRATTPLGTVRRSVGSLAVDEALRNLDDPMRATVLVVGAGEIGKLAARALARRVGHLLIANRDTARATDLAGPIGAEGIGLDALPEALDRADVAISAADTRGLLLTREVIAARLARRPLVLVDIAVPRSVAEDARSLAGLTYRDVDHLATGAPSGTDEVVRAAERRCSEEAAAFMVWLRERDNAGTIRALREHAEAIRERKLRRALRHLGHLTERDRHVVSSLAASLTHALIHEPTVRLRRIPSAERAARSLFGIEQ
mgnify:CR=1 FL=1